MLVDVHALRGLSESQLLKVNGNFSLINNQVLFLSQVLNQESFRFLLKLHPLAMINQIIQIHG